VTVEIGVLNRTAVALGADSAMTVTAGEGVRVYSSVNKLFAVSPHHAVGIMIHGSDEIMGIPWESVIKVYRNHLPADVLPRLERYAEHFIEFIERNALISPPEQQGRLFVRVVGREFDKVGTRYRNVVQAQAASLISEAQIETAVNDALAMVLDDAGAPPPHSGEPEISPLLSTYEQQLVELREKEFGSFPLSDANWRRLQIHAVTALMSDDAWNNAGSGLVIAGFGSDDLFPSLVSYRTFGVVGNSLQRIADRSVRVTFDEPANIVTFAQDDEIRALIHGIHPVVEKGYTGALRAALGAVAQQAQGGDASSAVEDTLAETIEKIQGEFRDRYLSALLRSIDALPKNELAALAEGLVTITALKQRVALEGYAASVGGPVDIAVISRGDGFVWVRRKSYFDVDLNPPRWAL
jgi:hypothetical protein